MRLRAGWELFRRNCEIERRAFARFGFHPDAAAVPLHYLFADGKPNTRTLVTSFGGCAVEQLEHSFLFLGWNTDAVVFYRKSHSSCLRSALISIRGDAFRQNFSGHGA